MLKTAVALFLTLLAATLSLMARIGGGSIIGVVDDPSGVPVVGVKILAHNQETNEVHRVATHAEGYYEFPLLPSGHYRLEAAANGFDHLRGEVFELSAGIRPRIELTFRLESFNTLNHPVFSNPVATVNNANFTQITTTSGSPRAYQVALKYAF